MRRAGGRPPRGTRGFTLVEVLGGFSLSTILLAAVLSTFLMIGRSGTNAASYMTMDAHSRRALQCFSRDVRMAAGMAWNSDTSVTLLIPNAGSGPSSPVTYAWDEVGSSQTYRCFYRVAGDASSTAPKEILARNVSLCRFAGFNRLNTATTDGATIKRIRVSMTLLSSGETIVNATDQVAGSFVLRNQLSL